MLRTTQDIVEIRRWAEGRGARPGREEASGRLVVAVSFPAGGVREVDWAEFEPTFMGCGAVFVYDDAPGASRCFVGPRAEAQALVEAEMPSYGPP